MKKLLCFILLLILFPFNVNATSGCCSHHGGVNCSYRTSSGGVICNDGWTGSSCSYSSMSKCNGYSPSTYGSVTTVSYIYGCTDTTAKNYNANANKDNGSCEYYKYGCTDIGSINYDVTADKDDSSCIKKIYGCTDTTAANYNSEANTEDNSCTYVKQNSQDLYIKENNNDSNEKPSSEDNSGGTIIGLLGLSAISYGIYKKFKK